MACQVCGDKSSGINFGAAVCLPCKSFFIRYRTEERSQHKCKSNGLCTITPETRKFCKFCRYMKCLEVGMTRKERPEYLKAEEGQMLCFVCGDLSNGLHFGIYTCEGCKKFFRRSIRGTSQYLCRLDGNCAINPKTRNECKACRYNKCLQVGMAVEGIRMGRPKKLDQRPSSCINNQKNDDPTNFNSSLLQTSFKNELNLTNGDDGPSLINIEKVVFSHSFMEENSNASYTICRNLEEKLMTRWTQFCSMHKHVVGQPTYLNMNWTMVDQEWFVEGERFCPPDITFKDSHRQVMEKIMIAYQDFHNELVSAPAIPDHVRQEVESSTDGIPHQIRRVIKSRLVALTEGWIDFFMNIPGVVTSISKEDLQSIIRLGGLHSTCLQLCISWYRPETNSLHVVYDVKWHPSNPHYNCQQTMLDIGSAMAALDLDIYEKALLTACSFVAEDWPGLKNTASVGKIRRVVIETFCAYLNVKYGQGNRRLEELFGYIAVIRRLGSWWYHLMDNISNTF